jgi:adenine phosphoribosyltransferase
MPIKSLIRTIPHHPRQGILFRDITPLLQDPVGFRLTVQELVQRYSTVRIDKVAAIESRGFILGAPLAYALGVGFVPLRKPGKLPAATVGQDYALEYGTDRLELHTDAIAAGERVLLVDDLIATGGTAEAAVMLIRRVGGEIVECAVAIDLPDVGGRARLERLGVPLFALTAFEGE